MDDLFTDEQIAALNEARDILDTAKARLRRIKSFPSGDIFDIGFLAATIDNASGAIFDTLNVTHSYRIQKIGEDRVLNRKVAQS